MATGAHVPGDTNGRDEWDPYGTKTVSRHQRTSVYILILGRVVLDVLCGIP